MNSNDKITQCTSVAQSGQGRYSLKQSLNVRYCYYGSERCVMQVERTRVIEKALRNIDFVALTTLKGNGMVSIRQRVAEKVDAALIEWESTQENTEPGPQKMGSPAIVFQRSKR